MSRSGNRIIVGAVAVAFAATSAVWLEALPQAPAALSGVVMSADAPPQPVRRAVVSLSSGELSLNLSAVTDDTGRFTFVNLQPGSYAVTASKAAFLTTAFGAKRPGQPGARLVLASGDRVADLRLTLFRGAVLAGTLRDQTGGPASNVPIVVAPVAKANGLTSFSSEVSALTDDRGAYRVYGLAPGEYVIAANRSNGNNLNRQTARLAPPTIDEVLRALQARESGRAPGAPTPAPPPNALQLLAPAATYYPGTSIVQDADHVRVAAGESREGLDFVIGYYPAAKIEGRVTMADGSPLVGTSVSVVPTGPPLPLFSELQFSVRQKADGAFEIPSLAPGRYVIIARGTPGTPPAASGRGDVFPSRMGGVGIQGQLWAFADVLVNGNDVTGLTLALRPSLSVSGRVEIDSSTARLPEVSKLRIGLRPAESPAGTTMIGGAPFSGLPTPISVMPAADTSFTIAGAWPGLYTFAGAMIGSTNWWLRSAMLSGRDLLDTPLDLGSTGGDVRGVALTFTDKHSVLMGRLPPTVGSAVDDEAVLVFPVDRALWTAKRRVRLVIPATDGGYQISDLPAGDYFVVVVANVTDEDVRQNAFLSQASGRAVRVVISDGATTRQDFRR